MTTVQRLFPWKFANANEGQARHECVHIREKDMFDALETMREPVFFTGYSGLLSELNSALLTVLLHLDRMRLVYPFCLGLFNDFACHRCLCAGRSSKISPSS